MITAVMPTYARKDVVFERGQGSYLFASDGRRFLDFTSGIAVNLLGHCHPYMVAALQAQAAKLWHTSNLYRIGHQERLAERLRDLTFADTMFFCNSGAEAIEGAIKVARKYQAATGNPRRYKFICFDQAFHGRTLNALAATGNKAYLDGFGPPAPGYVHVPLNNGNMVRDLIDDETAAILIEPIQGEGGVRPGNAAFLEELRRICDEFGLLLVFDEIQTGFGRTGKLFAYQWTGIAPDVMAIAKGIGGGFPLGAFLATEKAAVGMVPGTHGSTYGGNPLATAMGNAVLDVILQPGFFETVLARSQYARDKLGGLQRRHPQVISEVRGQGLMLGLRTAVPNTDLVNELFGLGMLTVGAGDSTVRYYPSLIVSEAEIDESIALLDKACTAIEGRLKTPAAAGA